MVHPPRRKPGEDESEKPPEPEGPSGFSMRNLAESVLARQVGTTSKRPSEVNRTPGRNGAAEGGYAADMRVVREESEDDLRAEVGQSVVLLGLVAVIGLMMGLAFQARGSWCRRMRTPCPIGCG